MNFTQIQQNCVNDKLIKNQTLSMAFRVCTFFYILQAVILLKYILLCKRRNLKEFKSEMNASIKNINWFVAKLLIIKFYNFIFYAPVLKYFECNTPVPRLSATSFINPSPHHHLHLRSVSHDCLQCGGREKERRALYIRLCIYLTPSPQDATQVSFFKLVAWIQSFSFSSTGLRTKAYYLHKAAGDEFMPSQEH